VTCRCVFCCATMPPGAPPEHVIPQWLAKFCPKGATFGHITYPELRGDKPYPPQRSFFRAKKFGLTADTVCADCNHHWMSNLESWASPILTHMIEGYAQGLSVERQVLISQWVAKTALTWDQSMNRESRMYPVSLCRWLYEHRTPPPGASVRLGRYSGPGDFVQMVYDAMYSEVPADPMPPGPPEAHRATIRIGQLVMEFTVTKAANLRTMACTGPGAMLEIPLNVATDGSRDGSPLAGCRRWREAR
jgi:hypothetical protein